MCLTLHLDNKRFLCLFVKFVLYRGPVLCEKHRISFFIFPNSIANLFSVFIVSRVTPRLWFPCILKRFPRTSHPKLNLMCAENVLMRASDH